MISQLPLRGSTPHPTLQQLIDRHGRLTVMLALMTIVLPKKRRRKRRMGVAGSTDQLGDYLRRDIGLPPYHREGSRPTDHGR